MSPLSKLLLLSCLACCAVACTVPSIEEVEQEEGPAGCNATDHTCPADFVCYENRCIQLTSDMVCKPGTAEDCTSSGLGECVAGARVCGAEGTFGACESKKKPAFERCDGLDNDCDGTPDNQASLNITRSQDADASLVALPLGGPGTDEPEVTLIVTTESGKVVTRTLSPGGTLRDGVTFPPATSGGRNTAVAGASAGLAAVAWLEQPGVLGGTQIKLYVALLDARGDILRAPVEIPYTNGGASPNASEVRLAVNSTHILVLVRTTGGASAPVPEIWALTIPVGLDQDASTAFKLANPQTNFGLHATENGMSTRFLVAYESGLVRNVATISNEGALVGNPMTLFRDPDTHSPFLVPTVGNETDYSLFYVRYDSLENTSYLSIQTYDNGTFLSPAPYAHAGFIERMQMTAPAGAPMPSLALWSWRNKRDSAPRDIQAARLSFSSDIVDKVATLSLSSSPTFSEVPVQLPGDPYYVVYQRDPAMAVSSAAPPPLEVNLQPFCKL
ncbi:putative metal-binding motif-containing protein [Archangium sp.]|uniref:putative metal-binding motif-containing protein n=1 Tax=Archangium sp. TaxID=1872627 RepID=UPI00389A2ED8